MSKIIGTVVGIERYLIPRKIIAQCDGCNTQYLGGDVWNTVAQNEAILISDGWSVHDGRHICPECRACRWRVYKCREGYWAGAWIVQPPGATLGESFAFGEPRAYDKAANYAHRQAATERPQ